MLDQWDDTCLGRFLYTHTQTETHRHTREKPHTNFHLTSTNTQQDSVIILDATT